MIECVWPVEALLGEGPAWDMREHCLWFVDIKRGNLHRFDPATGGKSTRAIGGAPSFVLPAEGGGLVMGNGRCLHLVEDTKATPLGEVAMPAGNRLNDATVDSAGRIWFGSMDDRESAETGAVYLYADSAIRAVGGAATITNGPAISGDGRWLYHVDTLAGMIWRFDIADAAELADGEPFARIDPADGAPDGVTIDAEDHVWVGLWGGWCARRYRPDGTLAESLSVPCANVTKIAFGGADLRTGFVTTARIGLDRHALTAQPLAGALFAFTAAVPGRPLPRVALPGRAPA